MIGGEDWDFWTKWESGEWEPETRAVLERFLTPESTYIDIGAWIGPTVLWAAPLCRRVIALEPDPTAFDLLILNTAECRNVELIPAALASERGTVNLFRSGNWGDSMSSLSSSSPMVGTESVSVRSVTFPDVWDDASSLVKMDIEGAECDVIGEVIPFLRERGVPLFLSVHRPFMSPEGFERVEKELADCDFVEVHADNGQGLFEVLCR